MVYNLHIFFIYRSWLKNEIIIINLGIILHYLIPSIVLYYSSSFWIKQINLKEKWIYSNFIQQFETHFSGFACLLTT